MTTGWARLHRSLLGHALWTGERFTRGQAWVDLILQAAFEDHESFATHGPSWIKRGQVLTTQTALARRWQWDRETVRAFLSTIELHSMVRVETSRATSTGYTLITVLNYGKFQRGDECDPASAPASSPASDSPSDPASTPHPCLIHAPRHKKGKKEKKTTTSSSAPALPAAGVAVDPFKETTEGPEAALNGHPPWPSPEALVELYNASVPAGHPRVTKLTAGRRKKAAEYLRQFPDETFWRSAFAEIGRSAFLRGLKPSNGHEGFRGDLDWLLSRGQNGTENIVKVAEGRYRDRRQATDDDEDAG